MKVTIHAEISDGKTVIVDISDMHHLICQRWYVGSHGYATNRTGDLLHRLIMGAPEGVEVDHKDGNRLNNSRSNLREASRSLQLINALRVGGESKHRGIYRNKKNWCAKIGVGGKSVHLGTFPTISDALKARIEAETLYYPERAKRA